MLDQLPLIFSAFLVGGLVGLTGVGGGAVMTPLLILFFSVQPVVAIATDLVFATVTKLFSAILHSRSGVVDWAAARTIWKGSIPGVLIGILVLVYVGTQFDLLLSIFLALVLIFTSFSMLAAVKIKGSKTRVGSAIGGGFIGFSVATTSVGAGALGMVLLRRQLGDESPKKLVGTDIVHAIPIALIAGVSYAATGLIDIVLLGTLLIGSVPGVIIGSLFTSRLSAGSLRQTLAVVLLLAAIGVLLKSFGFF